MSNIFEDVIGKVTAKTKEDELFEQTDEASDCPYGKCNGSGLIRSENDERNADFCQCYHDRVMTQRLRNSNINTRFLHQDFDSYDTNTKLVLFKPKKTPDEFKPNTRTKTLIDETSKNYIKRHYTQKKEKRTLQEVLKSYSEKNLELLNSGKKIANLLLFGEPGNGKTTFATLIGIHFLNKGKKVHFSTTQNFLDGFMNKTFDPKEIARTVDVLILDELFNEYHTDTQYAKKKLKEIFKMREDLGLITICTSNGTPKDFSLLYGDSMMSMINGTFFLFYLDRETDGRVEGMHDMYGDFGL